MVLGAEMMMIKLIRHFFFFRYKQDNVSFVEACNKTDFAVSPTMIDGLDVRLKTFVQYEIRAANVTVHVLLTERSVRKKKG